MLTISIATVEDLTACDDGGDVLSVVSPYQCSDDNTRVRSQSLLAIYTQPSEMCLPSCMSFSYHFNTYIPSLSHCGGRVNSIVTKLSPCG